VTAVGKTKPQVIDDQEHERVYDRVAAVDVAKDAGVVCTRTPHPSRLSRPGARRSTVWVVKARMGAVRAPGRQLKADGIEMVTLESTSDYWRLWFFVLEAAGLAVQLVNAAQARNLPGRPKTDKLDAMWLARLTPACPAPFWKPTAPSARSLGSRSSSHPSAPPGSKPICAWQAASTLTCRYSATSSAAPSTSPPP
jgi:hypothetical protein